MATLNLWNNFTKRRNSTKQPAGAADLSLDVKLKENCSIANPVFIVSGDYFTANYAQYAGMYYFVDDVVSVHNGLCEIHCSKDVLATYKSQIQASSAFVLYYNHSNTEIVDPRLSTKTGVTVASDSAAFQDIGTGESYMLTAVGVERTSVYALTKSDVDSLFNAQTLYDINNDFLTEITNTKGEIANIPIVSTADMLKSLATVIMNWKDRAGKVTNEVLFCEDAQRYVKNCYVLPIDISKIGGATSTIKLGKWDAHPQGKRGFSRIKQDSATVTIPWPATDWRRNEPYTQLYLQIPYIGIVNIPASEAIGSNTLTVRASIDMYSGVATFIVDLDNGTHVGQYSTNIGAPYAIGSSNISMTAAGSALVQTGFAVGAAAAGDFSRLPGAGLGLINAIKPFPATIGSNSGCAGMGFGNQVKCFSVFHDVEVANNNPNHIASIIGTPFNDVRSLSGVSGYVQTAGASVDMPGFGGDRDTVNSLLDGGIYIE